jgi:hypothetical protein
MTFDKSGLGGDPAKMLEMPQILLRNRPSRDKLFAYELCLSLVKLVAKTRVADAQLRAQGRKSAASAALNCAEGAARQTRADKSRAYAIALLALFRSVTQRSDGRRATPWIALMTDLFVALITTTELELRDPEPLRLR